MPRKKKPGRPRTHAQRKVPVSFRLTPHAQRKLAQLAGPRRSSALLEQMVRALTRETADALLSNEEPETHDDV